MITVNEYRKVGNSYVDTGDEYSVFSTDSILCARAVNAEQSDIFMVYTTGGMFVTDLDGVNLFGSELISINLYRKNFNIIKATGLPIRVNAKKVVTTYSAEPGYEIDGITPVTCVKLRLVNGFLIITDDAGVNNLSIGSTSNMQLSFKQGSIGEKVSFTKVSGTNPTLNKDVIIPGLLEITRGANGNGIYNIAQESQYNTSTYESPKYTFWNTQYLNSADTSWASLWDVQNRTYTNWRDAADGPNSEPAPPQYVGMPVVMKYDDGGTPRYWLIMFTEWGVGEHNEYGFAYDRWEILPAVEINQPSSDNTNTPNVIDILSEGVHITRSYEGGGLYNILNEPYANTGVSPRNTKWNSSFIDSRADYSGFQDLSNLESRVYTSFVHALDQQVGNNILDTDLIMHDMTTDLYYRVQFSEWAQGCDSGPGSVQDYDTLNAGGVGYPEGGWTALNGIGGNGTDIQMAITVSSAVIVDMQLQNEGQNYQVGDVITFPYPGVTEPIVIEVTDICSMGGFTYTRTVIPQSSGVKFADGTIMNTAVTSGGAAMNYTTGLISPQVESDFIALPDTITDAGGHTFNTYKLGGIATFDAASTSAYSYLIGVISGDSQLALINDASVIGANVNTYQVSSKFAVNAYVRDQASGNIIPLAFATIVLDNTIASPNDYFVSIVATAGAPWKGKAYIDIEFMSDQTISYYN